jgi:uncharacterized membrane protein YphA (DoxX/SURF4 family)
VESDIVQASRRKTWRIVRQGIGFLLLLTLAAIFFLSGWAKLQTTEPFAWSFIDVLPIGITTAHVLARIFIGLEWAIGAWLAAHLFLRRVTYKATIALVVLLTLYLTGLLMHQGNNGNCGCFGEWIYMKPLASIWKNLVLIAITILLWFIYPSRPYRNDWLVALVLTTAAFTVPFVIRPVYVSSGGEVMHQPIALDSLYQYGVPPPTQDLRKGKHIICFFSSTCPHCVKAAYLVQILHRQYPGFPIFMVISGGKIAEQDFFDETKSVSVPHTLLMNSNVFVDLAGPSVPAIYWVNNGIIERKTYYTALEPAAIREWLRR